MLVDGPKFRFGLFLGGDVGEHAADAVDAAVAGADGELDRQVGPAVQRVLADGALSSGHEGVDGAVEILQFRGQVVGRGGPDGRLGRRAVDLTPTAIDERVAAVEVFEEGHGVGVLEEVAELLPGRGELEGLLAELDGGADPGAQLAAVEWLAEVVVGAEVEALDGPAGQGVGGHEDDGQAVEGRVGPHCLEHFEAVEVWHVDVDEGEVYVSSPAGLKGGSSVSALDDGETAVAEMEADEPADVGAVIGDDYGDPLPRGWPCGDRLTGSRAGLRGV